MLRVLRRRAAAALGLVALLSLMHAGCDVVDSARKVSTPSQVAALDALLDPIRVEYGLPALAAAVTRRDGLIAAGAVGVRSAASEEPVARHDCFHIGSCTKAMTATLCAVLVDEGRLRWDSSVAEVFPDLAGGMRAEYHKVTLEQLLEHRAGLPDDRQPGPALLALRGLSGEVQHQRRELVKIAFSQPAAVEPGTMMVYSNFGYAVAGAMCEAVTGKAWEKLMRERIFGPLGMGTAGFGAPGTAGAVDQPLGHRKFGSDSANPVPVPPGPLADNPAVLGPAGVVHCSLSDWARFGAWFLHEDGQALGLKPGTLEGVRARVRSQGYSGGWGHAAEKWHGADVYQHAGSNSLWFAVIKASPGRNLAVLVATNAAWPGVEEACGRVAALLTERFDTGP